MEKKYNRRIYRFRKFIREHINLSRPCYDRKDIEAVTKDCDCLICGSDQIWNPVWYDPIYFLAFGSKYHKRIAYAPSGVFLDNPDFFYRYSKIGKFINQMDYVSVREMVSIHILKKYTCKNISSVLDPTFLLTQAEWNRIAAKRIFAEPYVFCYIMGSIKEYSHIIKNVMKRHKVKRVVYIPSNLTEGTVSYAIPYHKAGPVEFISLIKDAEAVCTDSFHGMAISVKYRKQFYILRRHQANSDQWGNIARMDNIINEFKIGKRLVSCLKDLANMPDIDYELIDSYINYEIKKSLDFLKNALEG